MAGSLKGTKSHDNLKDAFAGESQAQSPLCCYFARVADIEGFPDIAGLVQGHRGSPRRGTRSGTSIF